MPDKRYSQETVYKKPSAKKANVFVRQFMHDLMGSQLPDARNQVMQTLSAVSYIRERWGKILYTALKNAATAAALEHSTMPTHIEEGVLYVKVLRSDEHMLISLNAAIIGSASRAVLEAQKKQQPNIPALEKVKPVYFS